MVGEATSGGRTWLYCLNPGEGNCPDNATCNQHCLSLRYHGGGECTQRNQCCCKV